MGKDKMKKSKTAKKVTTKKEIKVMKSDERCCSPSSSGKHSCGCC